MKMMRMMMLLLVSTVALLLGAAFSSPTHHRTDDNLNHVLHLAVKYNKSLNEKIFVDDVSHLLEDGCKDTFFCKVYDILDQHKSFGKNSSIETKLLVNLKMYIDGKNPNCTVLLKDVPSAADFITIPKLLDHLTTCIRRKNTHA